MTKMKYMATNLRRSAAIILYNMITVGPVSLNPLKKKINMPITRKNEDVIYNAHDEYHTKLNA